MGDPLTPRHQSNDAPLSAAEKTYLRARNAALIDQVEWAEVATVADFVELQPAGPVPRRAVGLSNHRVLVCHDAEDLSKSTRVHEYIGISAVYDAHPNTGWGFIHRTPLGTESET